MFACLCSCICNLDLCMYQYYLTFNLFQVHIICSEVVTNLIKSFHSLKCFCFFCMMIKPSSLGYIIILIIPYILTCGVYVPWTWYVHVHCTRECTRFGTYCHGQDKRNIRPFLHNIYVCHLFVILVCVLHASHESAYTSSAINMQK